MSAWQPASPQAEGITALSLWMFGVATAVLIGVMVLLVIAVLRARRLGVESNLSSRQRTTLVVAGGVALPFVAAVALLAASVPLGSASAPATAPADALLIEVTGHRWWWEVHYLDATGQRIASTANEIHVPVGRAVKVRLKSEDVIHSFWAPNVQGKTDLVPGRTNELWFRVDREGMWRGQCAEFCGTQHAMMGFLLIGQPPEQFESWLARQAAPALEPADDLARQGRGVFEMSSCVLCHSVRGTIAGGRVAPDLTHIASRRTLAAARLPNGRGSLAAWITDPQKIKPGTHMPATPLTGDELHALLHYLEGLQ
jgi:cytochrome c oxidase subunit II